MKKNSYCNFCGSAIQPDAVFPYECPSCHFFTYLNPIPVAVLLVPVEKGLLVVRRNIEPFKGQLAFPGGFMDLNETWQEAASRELREETNIQIDSRSIKLMELVTVPNLLLIFGIAPKLTEKELAVFTPNSETSEIIIASATTALAFPEHNRISKLYFELHSFNN
jgi:8-oxo-dGTP pyrophosphatase MutT (NUDIX family)